MNNISTFFFILLSVFLVTCGASLEEQKEDRKKELESNTITLVPPPGTYESGVAVTFYKKTDDGTLKFIDEVNETPKSCDHAIPDHNPDCFLVNETETIRYNLWSLLASTDTKTATYEIIPKQLNISINDIEFKELSTVCDVDSTSDGSYKIEGRIKLNNPSYPNEMVYLFFEVSDTADLGLSKNYSTNSYSYDVGVEVKQSGETAPTSPRDFEPGLNSGYCNTRLDKFTLGQHASGEISCSLTSNNPVPIFGNSVNIRSVSWQCDNWDWN
jgi:hypothetical protein